MNNTKRILFVGDLRTANNYGAIATTESLLDLLCTEGKECEIKLIDSRSFSGTTPIEGLAPFICKNNMFKTDSPYRNMAKEGLKRIHLYNLTKHIKSKYLKVKNDGIPGRYDCYEETAKKVINDQIWRFEKRLIEWADIVIINSEGNIVNGTDSLGYYRNGGRYVLFFSYLSKIVFNKPSYIINHTVDPKNRDVINIIKNIYPLMDGIYVRERLSIKLLENIGVNNAEYIPDALWTHDFINDSDVKMPNVLKDFDFSKPYICLGDSSGILNKYSSVKWNVVETYTHLIRELRKICPNVVFVDGYNGENPKISKVILKNSLPSVSLNNCNYHELYYVLNKSKLFISGRWHASIIALLAYTPILLWGSDSHKTEALYSEIGYEYEFFDCDSLPLNIDRIVKEAQKIISDNHDVTWEKVKQIKANAFSNTKMLM